MKLRNPVSIANKREVNASELMINNSVMMNPTVPYLSSEHGAETVPPEPHRLMADIDAALGQRVPDLAQR